MSDTPRTDASSGPSSLLVDREVARELERKLAAMTLEKNLADARLEGIKRIYAADTAELNARLIQRREDYAAHSVRQAQEMQALRVKLEQSQARETEYRKELEKAINGLQEWCDDVDCDSSWDGWDSNFKRWKWGGIKELEQALSQPAPPVVPMADVKPLLEALGAASNRLLHHAPLDVVNDVIEVALTTFTSKYPDL